MAEFQEEQLFRGASQGQGFAPTQAPDITPFLRENMEISSKNYANLKSTRDAELLSNVQKTQDLYKNLGVFSTKALELASTIGEAYIDSRIIEGKNKMRSFGKEQNYGVSVAGQQEYDATKAKIKETSIKLNQDANKLARQGAPLEAVNYIKSLGSYEQIGAIEYYLTEKGKGYKAAKDEFMQSTTYTLYDQNQKPFTPSEINDDPVKHAIATRQFGLMYLADNVGIGKNFNPNNAAMSYLYKAMDQADETDTTLIRGRKAFNDAQVRVQNAKDIFSVNRDLNQLISTINGQPDEKGVIRSNAAAVGDAFDHLLSMYQNDPRPATKTAILDILKNQKVSAEIDPKQRTFREFYKTRVKALTDGMLQVDVRKNQEKKFEQDKLKDNLDGLLDDYIKTKWDGSTESLQSAVLELTKVAGDNDIFDWRASGAQPFIAEAKEKQERQAWVDLLKEADKNNTLSVKTLMAAGIPADLRKAYLAKAQQLDDIRSRIPDEEETKGDLKTALKTALGDASLDANFIGLNAATHRAMRIYRQKVAQNYSALGAEGAHEKAVAETTAMILRKEGDFTVADWKDRKAGDAPVSYWPRFTPTTTITNGKVYEESKYVTAFKKDNSIIDRIPLVPEATLEKVADQINKGAYVDMPGIYRQLGGDPVALLNRNLAAIGRTERMIPTPSVVIAQKTTDPSILALAKKARTMFDEQRVYAAATGGTTDPAFMTPAVIQHIQKPKPTPTGGGERSFTGALTYISNKTAYQTTGKALQRLGFKVAEHPDFGGVGSGHAANGYHPYGEAFDVTHHIGTFANSIAKTAELKRQIRALKLFASVIGPGDGDSQHETHLHLGGLLRPITQQDIDKLNKIFGGKR